MSKVNTHTYFIALQEILLENFNDDYLEGLFDFKYFITLQNPEIRDMKDLNLQAKKYISLFSNSILYN
jgi:hypothetical protein